MHTPRPRVDPSAPLRTSCCVAQDGNEAGSVSFKASASRRATDEGGASHDGAFDYPDGDGGSPTAVRPSPYLRTLSRWRERAADARRRSTTVLCCCSPRRRRGCAPTCRAPSAERRTPRRATPPSGASASPHAVQATHTCLACVAPLPARLPRTTTSPHSVRPEPSPTTQTLMQGQAGGAAGRAGQAQRQGAQAQGRRGEGSRAEAALRPGQAAGGHAAASRNGAGRPGAAGGGVHGEAGAPGGAHARKPLCLPLPLCSRACFPRPSQARIQ